MSQKQRVLKRMREQGFITRNECLKNYISRLSAIIYSLRKDGMNIDEERMENGDYKYILKDKPKEIKEYRVNGEIVARKVVW